MDDNLQRLDAALADGFQLDSITSDPATGVEVLLRRDELELTVTIPPREARTLVFGAPKASPIL